MFLLGNDDGRVVSFLHPMEDIAVNSCFENFRGTCLKQKIRKTTQKLPKLTSWWCFPESSVGSPYERDCYLWAPPESQTTGPQTTN